MEKTRFFLVQKSEDTEPINDLCLRLEDRRIDWEYETENVGTDTQIAVLITISWED